MTPLWDGLKDAQEVLESGNTSRLAGLLRQLADRVEQEADFMESVNAEVSDRSSLPSNV